MAHFNRKFFFMQTIESNQVNAQYKQQPINFFNQKSLVQKQSQDWIRFDILLSYNMLSSLFEWAYPFEMIENLTVYPNVMGYLCFCTKLIFRYKTYFQNLRCVYNQLSVIVVVGSYPRYIDPKRIFCLVIIFILIFV